MAWHRTTPRDYLALAIAASALSTAAFLYFFFTGQILFYGDAVAHINIARRVFDSRTPGWQQLGTVWLPLPHLLTMPFILSDSAWQSGWGGSVISMAAFVAGALGIARLFWGGALGAPMRIAGWIAAAFYLLNPNLLYVQSTAMTEALSLALYVWAIVLFAEFLEHRRLALAGKSLSWERKLHCQKGARAIRACALVLAAGMMTRYDHWFLTGLIGISSLCLLVLNSSGQEEKQTALTTMRRAWVKAVVLCAAVAALWLAYNFGTFGNALEFARGPYSARAIAQRTSGGMSNYPGENSLPVAALYYFKAAKLNLAEGWWIAAALTAAIVTTFIFLWQRRIALLLALWLPLLFYALAIAYASVPIFIPQWWPFSYYNVRYGMELLPAFAVSVGISFWLLQKIRRTELRTLALAAFVILLGAGYVNVWLLWSPICLREARANSHSRIALETELAAALRRLPPNSSLLMYTGTHSGALEIAGIHLARSINENNGPLWHRALAQPARSADYIIAAADDPVLRAAQQHPDELRQTEALEVPGQPRVEIYRTTARRNP